MKQIEELDKAIHFGMREATLTDVHNQLVPIRNKINEIIKALNECVAIVDLINK